MSKDNFSRRDFVRRSAAGLGGFVIAGHVAPSHFTEIAGPGKNEAEQSDNPNPVVIPKDDVIIENDHVRLVIGSDAVAKSLLFKSTGEECLTGDKSIPI